MDLAWISLLLKSYTGFHLVSQGQAGYAPAEQRAPGKRSAEPSCWGTFSAHALLPVRPEMAPGKQSPAEFMEFPTGILIKEKHAGLEIAARQSTREGSGKKLEIGEKIWGCRLAFVNVTRDALFPLSDTQMNTKLATK